MGKVKFYVNRYGYLIEIEQNPCRCHPFDLLITFSNDNFGKGKSYSYSYQNQRQINQKIRLSGWEHLK